MSIWRRIFGGGPFRRRRSSADTDEPARAGPDERLDRLLGELREKLNAFLIVRSAPPGELPTAGPFTVTKTNDHLFRLELPARAGGGAAVSILLNTRPYLTRQKSPDGSLKIQGLLRISEVELCRGLQEGSAARFLGRAEPPAESSLPLFQALLGGAPADDAQVGSGAGHTGREGAAVPEAPPQPSQLLDWSPFDADQMIARNTPNVLAHVLVHATPELESFLRARFSSRLRLLLIDELERLASPASRPEMNPGSRNLGLLQYEEALLEFRKGMADYLLRLERERIRRERGPASIAADRTASRPGSRSEKG